MLGTSKTGAGPKRPLLDALALRGRTEALLAAHVPLTLLLDLADPFGPHSSDVFDAEPGSSDWLPTPRPTED